jgi:radical SAM superfamily enzyme YgiQ (UPF0313 family)
MHVCLIKPMACVSSTYSGANAVPPIGVAYLAGALSAAGFAVTVIDAVGAALTRYTPVPETGGTQCLHGLSIAEVVARLPTDCDLLAVSLMFSVEWPSSRALLHALRQACPSLPIVVGGEHASALPELVLSQAPVDWVICGEGESALVELAKRLAAGEPRTAITRTLPGALGRAADGSILRGPGAQRIKAIDDIAPPAWELFPLADYLATGHTHGIPLAGRISMPILASRGCPYDCTFCSSPAMWTTRWRARSPQQVLDEICGYMTRYQASNFDFYDLTAIVDRRWLVQFCELILARKLDFSWQLPTGTRSEALDSEVLELMRRAGCRHVIYAPESGSPRLLATIRKKIDPQRMLASMRSATQVGLPVKANIVIGFPTETPYDLLLSWRLIAKMAMAGVEDVSVFPFSPYPGSQLFRELLAHGKLQLDDVYFTALAGQFDPLAATAARRDRRINPHISSAWLRCAALAMMASFYLISFTLRPWRAWRTMRHVLRGTPTTRLEHSLDQLRRKQRQLKRARRARVLAQAGEPIS